MLGTELSQLYLKLIYVQVALFVFCPYLHGNHGVGFRLLVRWPLGWIDTIFYR